MKALGASLILIALAACSPAASPRLAAPISALEQGAQLVEQRCSACHAVGETGDSPYAPAPPFREVVQRYDPEVLGEAFAEGVVTAHPEMPSFQLQPDEIEALTAYLDELKAQTS